MLSYTSPRLQALFATAADVVVTQQKKLIIFVNNPWEQMLVTIAPRSCGIRAESILS